jgi:selenoprotein W-related protein
MSAEIVIKYCTIWNYEPKAVSLAEKLLGLKEDIKSLTLMPGGKGAFEVVLNGKLLYSKLQTGEFPDFNAIYKSVQSQSWTSTFRPAVLTILP